MDQTIASLAKRDHALLLECASLEAEHIPLMGDCCSWTRE
jgi:galactokinase